MHMVPPPPLCKSHRYIVCHLHSGSNCHISVVIATVWRCKPVLADLADDCTLPSL